MPEILDPADPSHGDYLISTDGWRAEKLYFTDSPLFESTVSELLHQLELFTIERCGFITTEDQEIVTVDNTHDDPINNFFMEKADYEKALRYIYEETQREVLGIWHTHPNGYPWPSPRDIWGWPNHNLGWRYFLVSRGDVTEWELVRD